VNDGNKRRAINCNLGGTVNAVGGGRTALKLKVGGSRRSQKNMERNNEKEKLKIRVLVAILMLQILESQRTIDPTVFPWIIAVAFWWISKKNQRGSKRIVNKLESEKSKSVKSHQMTAVIIRRNTVEAIEPSQFHLPQLFSHPLSLLLLIYY
jgi:hypothetical protein